MLTISSWWSVVPEDSVVRENTSTWLHAFTARIWWWWSVLDAGCIFWSPHRFHDEKLLACTERAKDQRSRRRRLNPDTQTAASTSTFTIKDVSLGMLIVVRSLCQERFLTELLTTKEFEVLRTLMVNTRWCCYEPWAYCFLKPWGYEFAGEHNVMHILPLIHAKLIAYNTLSQHVRGVSGYVIRVA